MLKNATNILQRETNANISVYNNSSYVLSNNSLGGGNNLSYAFENNSLGGETEYEVTLISVFVTYGVK